MDIYSDVMSDKELEAALEELAVYNDVDVTHSLAQLMNENQMITIEEFNQILADTGDEPIKSSLPQQTRPSEPDNDTNVDQSIQRLLQNDTKLTKVNLNNMKRTPIPQIKRIIMALKNNEYIEMLSLANMGLYDNDVEPLIDVLEENESLRVLNLETNYLSGEFFARLFQAALKNQTLEEVKAVNQGVSFSTQSEKEIIKAIFQNRGLLKVSVNFRLPEGRHKVDQATSRNQEIRRILRRQAAQEARMEEERKKVEEKPKPEPKKEPKNPVIIKTAPSMLKTAGVKEFPKIQPPVEQLKPVEEAPRILEEPPKILEEPPRIIGDANPEPELPKWKRPEPTKKQAKELEEFSKWRKPNPFEELPKWKRPKVAEEEQQPKPVEETKAEPYLTKWKRPKPVEGTKAEPYLPSWRRPKPTEETKPSTSNVDPAEVLNKTLVKKSSSSEAVDGAEKPKPKLKKKKKIVPPVILADKAPNSNGVEKLPRPESSLTNQTSDSDVISSKSLTVPQDEKLLTTTTSVTSESDVSSSTSKPKRKVVRKKKIVKPESEIPSNGKVEETPTPSISTIKENGEENVFPKKKIIRKKKVIKKVDEEPKANGVESKSEDLNANIISEPKKVFSKTRLYHTYKD